MTQYLHCTRPGCDHHLDDHIPDADAGTYECSKCKCRQFLMASATRESTPTARVETPTKVVVTPVDVSWFGRSVPLTALSKRDKIQIDRDLERRERIAAEREALKRSVKKPRAPVISVQDVKSDPATQLKRAIRRAFKAEKRRARRRIARIEKRARQRVIKRQQRRMAVKMRPEGTVTASKVKRQKTKEKRAAQYESYEIVLKDGQHWLYQCRSLNGVLTYLGRIGHKPQNILSISLNSKVMWSDGNQRSAVS